MGDSCISITVLNNKMSNRPSMETNEAEFFDHMWFLTSGFKCFLLYLYAMLCLPHRCQPSFCCTSAPGPACASGFCSPLEGDEAEGRDAVWDCGGICDISLWDCPWTAHRETSGQTGSGTESKGEFAEEDESHGAILFYSPPLSLSECIIFPFDKCIITFICYSIIFLASLCAVHTSFQLILELCSTKPDKNVIMPHLERIRAPAALSVSSGPTGVNKT